MGGAVDRPADRAAVAGRVLGAGGPVRHVVGHRRDRPDDPDRRHRPAVAGARVLPGGRRVRLLLLRGPQDRRRRVGRRARAPTAGGHGARRPARGPVRGGVQPDRRPPARHLPGHRVDRPGLHRPAHPVQRHRTDRRLQRPRRRALRPARLPLPAGQPRPHAGRRGLRRAREAVVPRARAGRAVVLVRAQPRRRAAGARAGDRQRPRGRRGGHGRQRHPLQGRRLHAVVDVRRAGRRAARARLRAHRAQHVRLRAVGRLPRDDRPRRPGLDRRRRGRRGLRQPAAARARPLLRLPAADQRARRQRHRAVAGRAPALWHRHHRRAHVRPGRPGRNRPARATPALETRPGPAVTGGAVRRAPALPRAQGDLHMSRRFTRFVAAGLLLAVAAFGVAACGKSSSSGGGNGAGGIKAGPGVTDKTIKLGVLTDLSGVFAALGSVVTQANQAYWKEQNKSGGVCNRTVQLVVKDHGYDPQNAVSLYRDMAPSVLALQQLLGSPITAALQPTLVRDNMFSALSAWPPSLLSVKPVEITGATYDLEAINGIDWMMKNKGLKKGDKIGDLYFEGDYGEGGLKGVQYAAKQFGLKVVQQKIAATDTDMSGQIAAFKRAGVKAMWLTVGPKQLASAAGVAKSVGLNVPIGGNNPIFSPLLLKTAVGPIIEKNVTVFGSTAPASLDKPSVNKANAAYKKYYPNGLQQAAVMAGWSEAEVMNQVLTKACDNKDLSRAGIVNALHSISNLDTGGLISGPLDYTNVGQPSPKTVYVVKISSSAKGGEEAVGGPYEADAAKNYSPSS